MEGRGVRARSLQRVGGGPGRPDTYSSCSEPACLGLERLPLPALHSQLPIRDQPESGRLGIRTPLPPLQQVGSSSHEPCCLPKRTSLSAPTLPQIQPGPSPASGSSAVLLPWSRCPTLAKVGPGTIHHAGSTAVPAGKCFSTSATPPVSTHSACSPPPMGCEDPERQTRGVRRQSKTPNAKTRA